MVGFNLAAALLGGQTKRERRCRRLQALAKPVKRGGACGAAALNFKGGGTPRWQGAAVGLGG